MALSGEAELRKLFPGIDWREPLIVGDGEKCYVCRFCIALANVDAQDLDEGDLAVVNGVDFAVLQTKVAFEQHLLREHPGS